MRVGWPAMKTSNSVWMVLGVVCAAGLAGCGKSEPAASAPVAVETSKTAEPSLAAPALAAVKKASEAVVASL